MNLEKFSTILRSVIHIYLYFLRHVFVLILIVHIYNKYCNVESTDKSDIQHSGKLTSKYIEYKV